MAFNNVSKNASKNASKNGIIKWHKRNGIAKNGMRKIA
jgi:hypothetical protein